MSAQEKPWHGILTATATPFREDLSVDFDRYAEHIQWLAGNDTQGAITNGSLGEYQVLTAEERTKTLETSIAAAPKGFPIIAGVGAYGATESRRWAEHAAEAGAAALILLPPTSYRANDDEVVAIKEFSGDVRRVWKIHHHAPRIEVLVGADDVLLELSTGGVVGGVEVIPGATMFERRQYFLENMDEIRQWLMYEPRGHSAMSGATLQPSTTPDADWGVLYIEVSGCLPMPSIARIDLCIQRILILPYVTILISSRRGIKEDFIGEMQWRFIQDGLIVPRVGQARVRGWHRCLLVASSARAMFYLMSRGLAHNSKVE